MSGRYALIVANTEYTDPGLAQLKAPGNDAKEFWRVLSSPDICAFDDVIMLLNDDSYRVAEQIEIFFEKKKPDDLLLLYFSGHGVKDENGALYLAVRNTKRSRLRSTAIQANFIRSVMDECRSRRQVLILDCCNSGAFAQGTKAETGGSIGTATAFKGTGYGRVVLTASDATQFAWEGDKVIGETENSLFTHFLIKGLEGEADRSGEGRITLDDLYDYAYDRIVSITPKQTPGKWSFKQQGEIVLREHMRIEDVTPLPLPADLVDEIEDRRPYVREAAVQRLTKLVHGKNLRLARSAREALERMAEHDDSRTISRMALQALETIKRTDANAAREQTAKAEAERRAKEEVDRLAAQKAEKQRLARIEAERKAKEEAERLAKLETERKAKEGVDRLAAQKVEEQRLARIEAERKAKEEADRLAAQKVEDQRLARIETERKAKEEVDLLARIETERRAKEESDRLAALKAEADRLAKQKAEEERAAEAEARREEREKALMLAKERVAAFTAKISTSRAMMFGAAVVAVLVLGGLAIRAFITPGATPATEAPVAQSTLQSTLTPETQLSTTIPQTPTSEGLVSADVPALELGSTHPYADGATLVAVPAGEFTMGGGGEDNPAHPVKLSDYWIYSTEVTNQQYAFCVSLDQCTPPNEDNLGYSDYRQANDPVTGVTYEQAANYCEFVNGRLPTEAEWEKAAQSEQGGIYPWGDDDPSCDLLNFDNCLEEPASVVDYTAGASQYGALNMAGNAFEWVADWYDDDYYSNSPSENPQGPEGGTRRSVRSASYASEAEQVAVTVRNAENPQAHRADLGFRCVVDDPTYFAPFCEAPLVYETADEESLESCPVLEIKPVPFCNGSTRLANVTFVGPEESTIDPKNCIPSGNNPNLFTCTSQGTIVSISAACELNEPVDASCPPGYLAQGDVCILDEETDRGAGNCLAGEFNSSQQCCSLPTEADDALASLQACPVGTYYAARANACLPLPVQEIITVTHEVALASSCAASGGGGGGGGDSGGGSSGGCQATQAQIDACNANAPFYSWDSGSCSCEPAN